ncbi:MAG TPA: hypothetical protein VGM65_05795 [Candidatus Udaeobacter sp.]|jgi:hypothetical protein
MKAVVGLSGGIGVLRQSRIELGCVSAIDSNERTIWIVDAHRDDGNVSLRVQMKS